MKTLFRLLPRIISLCCGGGIGEFGSRMHFRTTLAVDYEKKFLKSFEANHPGIPTLCADIGKPETIAEAKKIAPEVEGIIASTPCKDVAQCKSMELADRYSSEMTLLYVKAIDWVEAYRPQFYICEIVKGIETLWFFQMATARLEQLGYKWTSVTLDAADFGVPQHRVRTFMLAVRKGLAVPACPKPTHGDDEQRKKNTKLKKYLTLKDAIYDLYRQELDAIKKGEKAHEKFLLEEMLGVAKLSPKRAFYLSYVPPGGNWKHLPSAIKAMLLADLEKKGKCPFEGLATRYAWLTTPGALRTGTSVKCWSMPIHPGMANATGMKLAVPPGMRMYRHVWDSAYPALLTRPNNMDQAVHPGVHPDDAKAIQNAGLVMRKPAWLPSGAVGATPDGDKRALINPGYRLDWASGTNGGLTGFYRRQSFGAPAQTLVASPSQQTTMRVAPIITRYLNVREYCRIMGLPDSFAPIGSVATKYEMIGNGICPAVMATICAEVAKVLPRQPKGSKWPKSRRLTGVGRAEDKILVGDAVEKLKTLPSGSVNCCVTSPPYYQLRDYGVAGQIGLEQTVDEYLRKIVNVFREVRRVLTDDGTCWIVLGDSYSGSNGTACRPGGVQYSNKGVLKKNRNWTELPPKNLIGIPWRVALALQADGWILRTDIVWHKPVVFPEPVKDRPTRCHEFIFLLSKSKKYYYDQDAIREKTGNEATSMAKFLKTKGKYLKEPGGRREKGLLRFKKNPSHVSHPFGRNKRSVWTILAGRSNGKGEHFATFPEALVEPCIKAGCPPLGIVIDPFAGLGTTGMVARKLGREFIGVEINPKWAKLAERNVAGVVPAEKLEAA